MAKPTNKTVAASAAVAVGGAIAAGKVAHDLVADRVARKRARRFRLDPDEPVSAGIKRVTRDQLDFALGLLDGRHGGEPDPIHDARKALKRARAILRLCRISLGPERFRQENTILRDAGRSLSGVRDAQVLLETLDELRSDEALPTATWSSFRDELGSEARALERLASDGDGRTNVVVALAGVRERIEVWSLPDDGDALAEGFELVYRKARRARRRALRHPAPENLHELRKRTKDVWHQGQLLSAGAPKRISKLRRRAHKLADVLGSSTT